MAIEKIGRYRIISELGQGAMGVVYKAEDPVIERPVAIKTIKLDLSKEELANFEMRFYREAKSAGRLNHPNIVTIYDVGKSDNLAYMAMEFLEGQSLRDLLDAHTALPVDKIVELAAQVADGLAYAHDNKIVHRDIKPANIMIVRDGAAKITDFGIAQMPAGSRTLGGTVLGSPKYMAPEQVVGQQVDGRSDIFSLGVVLYEMLTGESPFDGDNISAVMYRILNEVPPAPKALNPRLPPSLDHIVARALAKHPDDRYQRAADLAHDLRHYDGLPVPASSPAGAAPRTLERRATPRLEMGEETLFLNQITGGLVGPREPTKEDEASPQAAAPRPSSGKRQWPRLASVLVAGLAAATALVLWTAPGGDEAPTPHPLTSQQAPAEETSPTPLAETAPATGAAPPPPAEPPAQPSRSDKPPRRADARSRETGRSPESAAKKPEEQREQPLKVAGQASLTFAITPWGEIYIDGNKAGVSPPLKTLHLPPGKHRVEIRNLNFTPFTETVVLRPGTSKKIKYIFK